MLTSRFPCIKTHWHHPLCVPASELRIVEQFGSRDGAPFTLQSECVGAEALPVEERELISLALQQQQSRRGEQQQQQQQQQQQRALPAAFTEVGRRMPAVATKRKRASEDAEYLPASLAHDTSPKRRLSGACRLAVESIISAFKQTAFAAGADADGRLQCALSEQLVSVADAHVDHAPPHAFDAIVGLFLSSYSLQHNTSRARLLASTEYVAGRFFDHDFAQAFRDCHASFASLRVLTAKSNLRLPRPRKAARRAL